MHDLVEHGHSKPLGPASQTERQGANAYVHLHVSDFLASGAHDVCEYSRSATLACSLLGSTAQDVEVSSRLVLQEIHGVRVAELDVLVVVGIAISEPPLESCSVGAPA